MAVQFDDLVRQVMALRDCGEGEARRRAHRVLDEQAGRVDLGSLGPVEAEILATVLRDEYNRLERWRTLRHATDAERAIAEEQRLVVGMVLERLPDTRCKHCGDRHHPVPAALCGAARREYDAAGEIEQIIMAAMR